MKKPDKNKHDLIEGQISLFDIKITENPKKVTEKAVQETKIINEIPIKENEKHEKSLVLTEKQHQFLDKNKIMENGNLTRIIIYTKGSIGIETKEAKEFKTQYINPEGKEEFSFNKKSPVMPWDKIFYYSPNLKNIEFTKIQVDKLQKLLCKHREEIQRVVHRKGDENILVELTDKVISIEPIGWELPFESLNHVECEEDEVYMVPEKVPHIEEDPSVVRKKAKVGDYVQAMHGKKLIEGELFSEYNSGYTFNIIFENGTRHTAIPRLAIKKILKSA